MKSAIKYVLLEDGIPYDWDDYDVYGAVLYDVENDTIVTTKYGHGCSMSLDSSGMGYKAAIEEGVVTEEQLKRACLKKIPLYLEYIKECEGKRINVPCTVGSRCRLIKGDVILLSGSATLNTYGWGQYHTSYDHHCLVYSPSLNKLATVSPGQLSFSEETREAFRQHIIEKAIEKFSVEYLAHIFAYDMSYAAIDRSNYNSRCREVILNALPFGDTPDYSTASNPQREAKEAKIAAKKAAKMPELLEWAKSVHPEYNEEEVNALAEKVWNRHYA